MEMDGDADRSAGMARRWPEGGYGDATAAGAGARGCAGINGREGNNGNKKWDPYVCSAVDSRSIRNQSIYERQGRNRE